MCMAHGPIGPAPARPPSEPGSFIDHGSGTGGSFSPGSSSPPASLVVGNTTLHKAAMLCNIFRIASCWVGVAVSAKARAAFTIALFPFFIVGCTGLVDGDNLRLRELDHTTYRLLSASDDTTITQEARKDSLTAALDTLSSYWQRPLRPRTTRDSMRHSMLRTRMAATLYRMGRTSETCDFYSQGRLLYRTFGSRRQLRYLRKAGRSCMESGRVQHAKDIYAAAREIAYHYGWTDEVQLINTSEGEAIARVDSLGIATLRPSTRHFPPPGLITWPVALSLMFTLTGCAAWWAASRRGGDTYIHQHFRVGRN